MKSHDGCTYLYCENCGTYVVEGEWEAHQCDDIPKDIQGAIDHPEDFDTEALDIEVHDLKGNEGAGINNEGMEAQVRYLHYEAGMPWSEIRALLLLEEPKP